MSLRQCLVTTKGLVADPARGIIEHARRIAIAEGLDLVNVVPRNVTFGRWKLAGQLVPAGDGRLIIRPIRAEFDAVTYADDDVRNGAHNLGFLYATPVHSDLDAFEDHATVMFAALVACLSELPEYSRETGGTIYEIDGRITAGFDEYAPLATITTGGFTASARVLEQSSI
jgi:hypothetical protein